MDEYQDQNSTDETDPEESPVLTELRNQNRRLEKKMAELSALQAETELAAQTQRGEVAKETMNTLGLPGLTEDVLQWVQGDITLEAVIGALEVRSIPLPEGTERPTPEDNQTPSASSVGQIVADTAAGVDGRSFEDRLGETTTQAELADLMAEEGLVRSHS
jgi:hypothetical protein